MAKQLTHITLVSLSVSKCSWVFGELLQPLLFRYNNEEFSLYVSTLTRTAECLYQ